ncbi:hypothetical protein Sjap_011688 [Stephania japonica]|uniref:Condensin complex subunit 1 C-terminal domain-containing protein n=1 Tax=Stephania japonica TaxID=461633 RepID=A0AAP0P8A5_9MAGN
MRGVESLPYFTPLVTLSPKSSHFSLTNYVLRHVSPHDSHVFLLALLSLFKHSPSSCDGGANRDRNRADTSKGNELMLMISSRKSIYSSLPSVAFLCLTSSPSDTIFALISGVDFLIALQCVGRGIVRRRRRAPGGGRGLSDRNGDNEGGGDGGQFDVKALFRVLERLDCVLERIHLARFPDSLKGLIQTVAEIPVTALEFVENLGSYQRLSDLCFRILNGVLRPEHGDQTATAVEVLKALTPAILLLKSQARVAALRFVTREMMAAARDSEAVKRAVIYLPRYLANKAPEKAEPRAFAVESIMEAVRVMDVQDQIGFVEYVVKMTQGKSNLRLTAVDLIPMLLMSLMNSPDFNETNGGVHQVQVSCLEAMIQRCSDTVAGTRARALSNLAQIVDFLCSGIGDQTQLVRIMGDGGIDLKLRINDVLRTRCMDEKAAVRKAALLLIAKSTILLGSSIDDDLLKVMGNACSDQLVSIRKGRCQLYLRVWSIGFGKERVIFEWLRSVPHLITDNESSIQEECENLFMELVLDRLSRAVCIDEKMKDVEGEIETVIPEEILTLLKGICDPEVIPCLKKICTSLGKKKRLKYVIAAALQSVITASESHWLANSKPIEKWTAPPGAWLLLSEVSTFLPKSVSWEFLHHHWRLLDKSQLNSEAQSPLMDVDVDQEHLESEGNSAAWAGDRVFLLQTISNVAMELPEEPAAELAHNLLDRIEKFNMHSTEVNAHVKALRTLCKRKVLSVEGDVLVLRLSNRLVSKALGILQAYISESTVSSKASAFLTPPKNSSGNEKKTETSSTLLLQAVTAVYTIGSAVMVCPKVDLKGVTPVLHTIITSDNSDTNMKKLPCPPVSVKQNAPSLYIQSWVTMGKICLADGKLAKSYIPLFVQELEKSDFAALRNNIIFIMADFCVRYTILIDCYIPKITNCLRDPCEVVRRQTFILLSRLLQRDYVKWRGLLFLRFLLCLVDSSEKIRRLADFLFGNILKRLQRQQDFIRNSLLPLHKTTGFLSKAPLLAYNSFVEAFFVLNDCRAHAGHREMQGSRAESKLFSIRGPDDRSRSQRMHIYITLLKQMAPEHLLATFAKLCSEILAAVPDGLLNLNDVTAQSVLKVLILVIGRYLEMDPIHSGASAMLREMDEEGGGLQAILNMPVQVVIEKSNIRLAIVIIVELRRCLRNCHSELKGSVMFILRMLLPVFVNDLPEIVRANKRLGKVSIYLLRKNREAKASSTLTTGRYEFGGNFLDAPPRMFVLRLEEERSSPVASESSVDCEMTKRVVVVEGFLDIMTWMILSLLYMDRLTASRDSAGLARGSRGSRRAAPILGLWNLGPSARCQSEARKVTL